MDVKGSGRRLSADITSASVRHDCCKLRRPSEATVDLRVDIRNRNPPDITSGECILLFPCPVIIFLPDTSLFP